MRILIIEDEKLLADSLKALLEQNGFEADAACDGKTGEYYAALGIYDLLILDVMMPGRDGGPAASGKADGNAHPDADGPI